MLENLFHLSKEKRRRQLIYEQAIFHAGFEAGREVGERMAANKPVITSAQVPKDIIKQAEEIANANWRGFTDARD